MKLQTGSISALDSLLQTASIVGIDKLVISDSKIRGIDEKKTVGIVTDKNVPSLEGNQLAITRVKQLVARMTLIKAQGEITINATTNGTSPDITSLELQGGRSKAQFRCASIDAVKGVPKGFNDPLAWEVVVSSKIIPLIAQADTSMASDGITIASKDGATVSVELVDSTKDVCTFELEVPAKWIGAGPTGTSFCNKYSSKSLLSLLREASKTAENVTLTMGQGGLLLISVNGFELFTLPQA